MRATAASVDIESLETFDALVASGATAMRGWRLQDLDLSSRTAALLSLDPGGAVLLGCTVERAAERHLRDCGALLFPGLPDVPFDPYRAHLYTAEELYAGVDSGYESTPDAVIFAWSRQRDEMASRRMAEALHDHAIDEALGESLAGRSAVGVMGGHADERGTPGYEAAARLGRALATAGLVVVTGGGPGTMEAANLGAATANRSEADLAEALRRLAAVPSFRPSVQAWAQAALGVRAAYPGSGHSVAIPTWFYGHEPPNVFAVAIAKYFQNSLREDTLLRHCDAGIAFLPGAGGTVQEIFQDCCENYYADAATVTPMVLVGKRYWTETVPAWPLLHALGRKRAMASVVHLVDSLDEACDVILHRP